MKKTNMTDRHKATISQQTAVKPHKHTSMCTYGIGNEAQYGQWPSLSRTWRHRNEHFLPFPVCTCHFSLAPTRDERKPIHCHLWEIIHLKRTSSSASRIVSDINTMQSSATQRWLTAMSTIAIFQSRGKWIFIGGSSLFTLLYVLICHILNFPGTVTTLIL